MNDINKLKQILDNAPEGATHYVNNEYCYRKETEEDFYLWANERWVLSSQVYFYTNSLSDLRTIVEQAERIAELEERIAKASDVAAKYAYIDGAHHKNWVINEMLCAIQTEDELVGNGWKDSDWLEECIAP